VVIIIDIGDVRYFVNPLKETIVEAYVDCILGIVLRFGSSGPELLAYPAEWRERVVNGLWRVTFVANRKSCVLLVRDEPAVELEFVELDVAAASHNDHTAVVCMT
jgi:hypothetical protein